MSASSSRRGEKSYFCGADYSTARGSASSRVCLAGRAEKFSPRSGRQHKAQGEARKRGTLGTLEVNNPPAHEVGGRRFAPRRPIGATVLSTVNQSPAAAHFVGLMIGCPPVPGFRAARSTLGFTLTVRFADSCGHLDRQSPRARRMMGRRRTP